MSLLKRIKNLKKGKIGNLVRARTKDFKNLKKKSNQEWFKELCFCVLTANYSAEGGIKLQKKIGNGFLILPKAQLMKKLKSLGYRYPNRAEYIVCNRKYKDKLKGKAREWLIKNIKGLGYKEASHFLRNTGHDNMAIIDFHILDILERYRLIRKPKTLTKKRYLEIEKLLRKIAKEAKLSLAELDLYLWYLETGKVLK